jgi:hypothetical protein
MGVADSIGDKNTFLSVTSLATELNWQRELDCMKFFCLSEFLLPVGWQSNQVSSVM